MSSPSATRRAEPGREQISRFLRRANEVGRQAMVHGHHPFGAVLVGPDGETILREQGNINTLEHAEVVLLRRAYRDYSPDFMWGCTLYTNVEPCAMCAGAAYWSNLGALVFGMSEAKLLEITGHHHENPTMSVGAQFVFDRGQKPIVLIGPVPEIEPEIVALHRSFWPQR